MVVKNVSTRNEKLRSSFENLFCLAQPYHKKCILFLGQGSKWQVARQYFWRPLQNLQIKRCKEVWFLNSRCSMIYKVFLFFCFSAWAREKDHSFLKAEEAFSKLEPRYCCRWVNWVSFSFKEPTKVKASI